MPTPIPFLDTVLLGNTMRAWIVSGAIFTAVYFGLWTLKKILVYQLRRIAQGTRTQIDDLALDLLSRVRLIVLVILAVFAATFALEVPETRLRLIRSLAVIALVVQAGLWGHRLVAFWLAEFLRRRGQQDADARMTLNAMSFIARLFLWATVALIALDNLGVKVTGLITGLGVGGIAVALAAQELLKDFFASLSITFDRPFVLGDFVQIDGYLGSIEHIGAKTTRLRSLSGEQIVVPNSDIVGTRLRNFGRMLERRVVLTLDVTYQTPPEKVELAVRIAREAVERREGLRLDRAHFSAFLESALRIETVYFVDTPNYTRHMDLQQEINLEILRRFAAEGIEFAYPTRTLFVDGKGTVQIESSGPAAGPGGERPPGGARAEQTGGERAE